MRLIRGRTSGGLESRECADLNTCYGERYRLYNLLGSEKSTYPPWATLLQADANKDGKLSTEEAAVIPK